MEAEKVSVMEVVSPFIVVSMVTTISMFLGTVGTQGSSPSMRFTPEVTPEERKLLVFPGALGRKSSN